MLKKWMIFLLCAGILFVFAGCNKNETAPILPEDSPPAEAPTEEEAPREEETPEEKQPKEVPPPKEEPQPEKDTPLPKEEPKPLGPQSGEKLAYFETPLLDRSKGRMKNLKLACKALNGKVVEAGETFSFNRTLGRRTKEKGYEEGIVFVDKEKVKEVGGGICQVSSTLYNAALEGKFEILERHEHQLEVDYVKKGKDATVNYNDKDLRFRNNRDYAVIISAKVTKKGVAVAFNVK